MSDTLTMNYTLDQFAADIRAALKADAGPGAKAVVGRHVSRALTDPAFVAAHLKDRASGANPREILYEDPELGFCICGHVYDGPANGSPHDHGESWAIYGQATGVTEMTDWKIVERGDGRKAQPGRAGADLRDEARRRAFLRRRRRAFAAARGGLQADPHRGQEPRPREALAHQGEVRRPRLVMPAHGRSKRRRSARLVAGIHVLMHRKNEGVDGRDKPGPDGHDL